MLSHPLFYAELPTYRVGLLHKKYNFFAIYLHGIKKSTTFAAAFENKQAVMPERVLTGPLAQLNRVPHYGCGGCRFESCMDHDRQRNEIRSSLPVLVPLFFQVVTARGHCYKQ